MSKSRDYAGQDAKTCMNRNRQADAQLIHAIGQDSSCVSQIHHTTLHCNSCGAQTALGTSSGQNAKHCTRPRACWALSMPRVGDLDNSELVRCQGRPHTDMSTKTGMRVAKAHAWDHWETPWPTVLYASDKLQIMPTKHSPAPRICKVLASRVFFSGLRGRGSTAR